MHGKQYLFGVTVGYRKRTSIEHLMPAQMMVDLQALSDTNRALILHYFFLFSFIPSRKSRVMEKKTQGFWRNGNSINKEGDSMEGSVSFP